MQAFEKGNEMKIVCGIVAALCTFGCSQSDAPQRTDSTHQQESSSITLASLVYVDELSAGYQHPLVCGPGGDFPSGQELLFKHTESNDFIHAVFPEEIRIPDELQGNFVLQGQFQGIQDRTLYTRKKPPEDYDYFVVSSWEYQE